MTSDANQLFVFDGLDEILLPRNIATPGFYYVDICPWFGNGTQACFFMHAVTLALRKYNSITPESRYWFFQGYEPVQRALYDARNKIGLAPRLPIHADLVNALNSHMPPEAEGAPFMLKDVMKALEHYNTLHLKNARTAPMMPPAPAPVPAPILQWENGQIQPLGAAPVLQQPIANAAPMVDNSVFAIPNHILENGYYMPAAASPIFQQPDLHAGGMATYDFGAGPNFILENGQFFLPAAGPNLQQTNQVSAPGSCQANAIYIDDGEELIGHNLQMNAADAPADERRDSGVAIDDDSEMRPREPVDNWLTLPTAGQDGAPTAHPTIFSNSHNQPRIQPHGLVNNINALPTAEQVHGAVESNPNSPDEVTHTKNPLKRPRNGPATMPGLPVSFSAPPRPFDANTQIKRSVGKLDKYEWWMGDFVSLPSIPEPGQPPTKKQCKEKGSGKAKNECKKKSPGKAKKKPKGKDPGEAEERALELALQDSTPTIDNNQEEAEFDEDSLEAQIRAALNEQ